MPFQNDGHKWCLQGCLKGHNTVSNYERITQYRIDLYVLYHACACTFMLLVQVTACIICRLFYD